MNYAPLLLLKRLFLLKLDKKRKSSYMGDLQWAEQDDQRFALMRNSYATSSV